MTAIMVDARKPGLSGWTFLGRQRRVRVSGTRGALVILQLEHTGGVDEVHTWEDTIFLVPAHIFKIRAHLKIVKEGTRVFIDLIGG